MNVNNNSLQPVDAHWAVVAVGEAERERGLAVANARLVKQALGQQIRIDFPERDTDDDVVRRLAMAYEMNWLRVLQIGLSCWSSWRKLMHERTQQAATTLIPVQLSATECHTCI